MGMVAVFDAVSGKIFFVGYCGKDGPFSCQQSSVLWKKNRFEIMIAALPGPITILNAYTVFNLKSFMSEKRIEAVACEMAYLGVGLET